jgi:tetratricopeptide (TPR) repeat protein
MTPEELDQAAAALQSIGRWDEYLDLTEGLVARYPERADVHLHRARALAFGGGDRHDAALAEVEVAARVVREEPQDLMRLAAVRLSLGETEGVNGYLERATRAAGLSSPTGDPSLAYLAGLAALVRRDDAAAQPLLEAAITGNPREADYARDLARLYIRVGRDDRARAVAARALEASPDDERLRRLADPVSPTVHAEAWLAAATQALAGQLDDLLCPSHSDGKLVWEQVASEVSGARRYRLYCPMCGAEVTLEFDAPDPA